MTPARTVIHLQSFGAGVDFLLDRWEELKAAFDAQNFWNSLALVKQAVRLYGFDPDRLAHERLSGSHFAVLAVSCIPGHKGMPRFVEFLADGASPEWRGLHGQDRVRPRGRGATAPRADRREDRRPEGRPGDVPGARRGVAGERRGPGRWRSRTRPGTGCWCVTPRATESSFDRTLKTLTKMQAERARTEAAEAREGGPKAARPNEADQGGE